MKYKAILFDNDGTLVNTEPIFFETTRDIFANYNVELTYDFFVNEHLTKNVHTFDLLRRVNFSEEQIKGISAEREVLYGKRLRSGVELMDGTLKVLESLSGKVKMGIVTSSWKENLDIILDGLGIRHFFDFIVTADEVKVVKPDPTIYKIGIDKSGFSPSECVAIEDTERGVVSARRAGIDCYAVPHKMSLNNDFSKANGTLRNIKEIISILGV